MAFTCTALASSAHVDGFRRDGDGFAISVHVGYDAEKGANYVLVVGLSPAPPGNLEFYFAIVEVFGDGDEVTIFDAKVINAFVPRQDRAAIRKVLLQAARGLVDWAKPVCFFMATHADFLPEKALVKFYLLLEVFRSCGMHVSEPNTYHGRHMWWAERVATIDVESDSNST
ncbi:MAG: hypothetical protein AB7O45_06270 [Alphaproteobacteria bacterium]